MCCRYIYDFAELQVRWRDSCWLAVSLLSCGIMLPQLIMWNHAASTLAAWRMALSLLLTRLLTCGFELTGGPAEEAGGADRQRCVGMCRPAHDDSGGWVCVWGGRG